MALALVSLHIVKLGLGFGMWGQGSRIFFQAAVVSENFSQSLL